MKRKVDMNKIMERGYYMRLRSELKGKIKGNALAEIVFDVVNDDGDVVKHRVLAFLQFQVNGIISIPNGDPHEIREWLEPLSPKEFIEKKK